MKRLLITYHMVNARENAETCTVMPMEDTIANDILTWGDDSRHLHGNGVVRKALDALARMQGYQLDCFCCAKEVG